MSLIKAIYSRRQISAFNWQNPPKYNPLWEEGLTPQPEPDLTWQKVRRVSKTPPRRYKFKPKVPKQVRVKRQNRFYFRTQLSNVLDKRTQRINDAADRLKQAVKNLPEVNQRQIILSPRPATGSKAWSPKVQTGMGNLNATSKVALGLATAGSIYLAARNNLSG